MWVQRGEKQKGKACEEEYESQGVEGGGGDENTGVGSGKGIVG